MTTAEALESPRPSANPRVHSTQETTLTVTEEPDGEKRFTAAEVLDVAMAAYERGRTDQMIEASRARWNAPDLAEALRAARRCAEIEDMRRRSATAYDAHQYPAGYDYKGGPVDWETGMPGGSACAWLRRRRLKGVTGMAAA